MDQPIDSNQLLALIAAHKWIGLAVLVINLIVRLLKSDTKIPITINPRLRALLAIGLGAAVAVVNKLTSEGNPTWTDALVNGGIAAVGAILLHIFVVDAARGGKELPIPGLIIPGTSPAPGKPITISPPPPLPKDMLEDTNKGPTPPTLMIFLFVAMTCIAVEVQACDAFNAKNLPNTILTVEQIACILEHAFLDDANLNAVCSIVGADQMAAAKKIQQKQQAVLKEEARRAKAEACFAPDGGK